MSTAIKNTIYSEYVFQQIYEIRCSGGGVFNFHDLAAKLQLKPTHNLRKRLRQAEAQNALYITYGKVGDNGTEYLYHLKSLKSRTDLSKDLPF